MNNNNNNKNTKAILTICFKANLYQNSTLNYTSNHA